MKKIFEGQVVSNVMAKTAVVDVVFKTTHPVYKKILTRNKKFKADTGKFSVNVGNRVKIVETKPISKDKYFKIMEVMKDGSA